MDKEVKITPKYIISDNGKQYCSKVVKDYAESNNIKLLFVPKYTPSANGISERLNQTLTFLLSISKGKTLLKIIKKIENFININYNRKIKTSPFVVCFGYDFFDIANKPHCYEYLLKIYKFLNKLPLTHNSIHPPCKNCLKNYRILVKGFSTIFFKNKCF